MFNRVSLIFLFLSSADAFIASKRQTRKFQISLYGNSNTGEDFSGGAEDVEAARRRFEAMMDVAGDTSNVPSTTKAEVTTSRVSSSRPTLLDVAEFPSLTSIAKERRLAEIHLLSSLNDSDEGLEELWNLWGSERGPEAARLLREADGFTLDRGLWEQAETILRQLIDTHGMHWVEPVNRLATLYFMQGRLEESRDLCLKVLEVKPWHFAALSGIVMVHAGLHELPEARYWAGRRLPPLQPTGPNLRRQQWVVEASKEARDLLTRLEDHTRESYGASEHPGDRLPPPRSYLLDGDEDAWQ